MVKNPISIDTIVHEIIKNHPQTANIFCKHGCPDMSKGIPKYMSKIMKLKWACKIHRIEASELIQELNKAL
jgi:hypothetical protein